MQIEFERGRIWSKAQENRYLQVRTHPCVKAYQKPRCTNQTVEAYRGIVYNILGVTYVCIAFRVRLVYWNEHMMGLEWI